MKKINEFIFEEEHIKGPHGIYEMSQISDIGELPRNSSVLVYKENEEQVTKPPHFHIKIDNGKFEFEIKFDNFHDLNIWRSKTIKHNWNQLKIIKRALKEWLIKKNSEEENRLNIEVILIEWNRQNPNHKIDKTHYIDLYNKFNNNIIPKKIYDSFYFHGVAMDDGIDLLNPCLK